VNADQHGAQLVVGQHHAHRHAVHREARMGGGFGLQQFGVPGIRKASRRQRFLVQRRRHEGGDVAPQCGARSPDHAVAGHAPGFGADAAGHDVPRRRHHLQHGDATRRGGGGFGHVPDFCHRPRGLPGQRQGLRCAAHRGHVAGHEGAVRGVGRPMESLDDDFRTDARGVAQRDGDGSGGRSEGGLAAHAGLSMSMNSCFSPSWAATCAATAGAP
jgi:hypothetical protein